MAIYRTNPTCIKCGEMIYGIYKDRSNLPIQMQLIDDTFVKWDYEGHKCNIMKKCTCDPNDLQPFGECICGAKKEKECYACKHNSRAMHTCKNYR